MFWRPMIFSSDNHFSKNVMLCAMQITLMSGSNTEMVEVADGSTVLDLLRMKGVSPDISIVFAGDKTIPVDSPLQEGLVLQVVSVASGG